MLDQKWLGTDVDRRDMRMLNLEQVVRRNFGRLAMFGFASTLLGTWEVVALSLGVSLSNGGTAGLFWNYFIASIGLGLVYASIAELSSMVPTAGGQYYWVALMAPRRCRRFLSYITGWLCAITWQSGVASSSYFAGTIVQALIGLNHPDYNPTKWQGSLLTLAFLAIAVLFNTVLARKLPMMEGIFVIFHILGILVFIPVWIMSPRRHGGSPLVDFYNPSGWATNGLATLVGVAAPLNSLIGLDCSVHMSEEARDSSLSVPVTLLVGYTSNVLLGFFVLVTCIYTIGPLSQALQAPGYPVINIFYIATQNLPATDFMTAILIFNTMAACVANIAAASRQLWAFARNNGVPFSQIFAPSRLSFDIPLNSILFSLFTSIVLALINIGSSEALAIILSIYDAALIASYAITIGCVLLYRLHPDYRLPHARYSLGKWGALVNAGALIYIIPVFVFSFFPSAPNPTAGTMNWASAMVGGVVVLATAYYFLWGRRTYTPPQLTIEDYIERHPSTTSEKEVSGGHAKEDVQVEKRDMGLSENQ